MLFSWSAKGADHGTEAPEDPARGDRRPVAAHRSSPAPAPTRPQGGPAAGRRPPVAGGAPLAAAQWGPLAGDPRRPALGQRLLASPAGVSQRRGVGRDPGPVDRRAGRAGPGGPERAIGRRDLHPRQKRGDHVGKTKVGKGMKLEVVYLRQRDCPWVWRRPPPMSVSRRC